MVHESSVPSQQIVNTVDSSPRFRNRYSRKGPGRRHIQGPGHINTDTGRKLKRMFKITCP